MAVNREVLVYEARRASDGRVTMVGCWKPSGRRTTLAQHYGGYVDSTFRPTVQLAGHFVFFLQSSADRYGRFLSSMSMADLRRGRYVFSASGDEGSTTYGGPTFTQQLRRRTFNRLGFVAWVIARDGRDLLFAHDVCGDVTLDYQSGSITALGLSGSKVTWVRNGVRWRASLRTSASIGNPCSPRRVVTL
jgi:hypothetical protein